MRINRRGWRFHDPWSKRTWKNGGITGEHSKVGDTSLLVNLFRHHADYVTGAEAANDRYILGNNSVEKIKK